MPQGAAGSTICASLSLNQSRPGMLIIGASRWSGTMSLDHFGAAYRPHVLSLFRFITGLLLFQYGVAKIFKFPALPNFADIPPLIVAAGALELVLGGLLMIGLFTRISAFIL